MPGIPWSRETDNVIVLKDSKQEISGRINKKRDGLALGQNVDILWKEMLTVYSVPTGQRSETETQTCTQR